MVSEPKVVAEAIGKAVDARSPKSRSPVGKYAKPSIAIQRFGGDRIFDRVGGAMV